MPEKDNDDSLNAPQTTGLSFNLRASDPNRWTGMLRLSLEEQLAVGGARNVVPLRPRTEPDTQELDATGGSEMDPTDIA